MHHLDQFTAKTTGGTELRAKLDTGTLKIAFECKTVTSRYSVNSRIIAEKGARKGLTFLTLTFQKSFHLVPILLVLNQYLTKWDSSSNVSESLINNWMVTKSWGLGASGVGSKVGVLTIRVPEANPERDSVRDGLWRPGGAFFQIGLGCVMSHHHT